MPNPIEEALRIRGSISKLLVCALVLMTFSATGKAFQGTTVNAGDVDRLLGTLNVWVMILAIFVTVVIAASAFNVINQYYQAGKFGERVKADLIAQMEKEISALKETYKLVELKPPTEILKEAQKDYMPIFETLRAIVERQNLELNSTINKTYAELSASIDLNQKLIEELRRSKSHQTVTTQTDVSLIPDDGKSVPTSEH